MIDDVNRHTVRATDADGKVQYEQKFEPRPGFDAGAAAKENARKIATLFPECRVEIESTCIGVLERARLADARPVIVENVNAEYRPQRGRGES